MKKIGFITSPLTSGHAVRGVGFYTKRLLPHLKFQAKDFSFEIVDPTTSDYDLLHYPFFDLFTHTLPIFKKTKTVVTIHDVIPLEFPDHYPSGLKGWLNLQLQKISLSGVDRVITDSHASIVQIHKFLRVPHNKLKLVYLAADPVFKKITKPKNKFKLPKNFVLYVGDINYNKNIPNLVNACQLAKLPLVIVGKQAAELSNLSLQVPSGPQDVIRKIIGKTHPQIAHLSELEEMFKSKDVIRLGFVSDEDLADIYNLASVYCQPSLAEGFGLPLLEALNCGTPVACSNNSSLPEIGGDQAEYFDPTSWQEMANAIVRAVGKKITLPTEFSWQKTAFQTLQVYSELL